MAGTTFVTQAGFEVSGTKSFATRVTQAALQVAATTSYATRVTQAAFNLAAWRAYATRVTSVGFNVWVLRLGSSSLPPGLVFNPGPFTEQPGPTGCDCAADWAVSEAECPGWTGGTVPATSWTPPGCPGS